MSSKQLSEALRELQNRGDSELAAEVQALLSAPLSSEEEGVGGSGTRPLVVARRLLAHAAKLIREGNTPEEAHNYLGAAHHVMAQQGSVPDSVLASLTEELAPEPAFSSGPLGPLGEEGAPDFFDASPQTVSSLAGMLLNGGYVEEARQYLTAYHREATGNDHEEGEYSSKETRAMKTTTRKEMLKDLQSRYRKSGDLVRARALDEILADMDEESDGCESRADLMEKKAEGMPEKVKEEAMKAAYMMRAAEEMAKDPDADQAKAAKMMKAAEDLMDKCAKGQDDDDDDDSDWDDSEEEGSSEEDMKVGGDRGAYAGDDEDAKPELKVEAPSEEEEEVKEKAQAALAQGETTKARSLLSQAARMEKMRVISALIKAGDTELAMEGLSEAEDDEDKNAGMKPEDHPADEHHDDEDEHHDDAGSDSEMPDDLQKAADSDKKSDDEKALARSMSVAAKRAIRAGDFRRARSILADLDELEKCLVSAVSDSEKVLKSSSLAKEGYELWKFVRNNKLVATCALAEAEDDDAAKDEALKAMKAMGEEAEEMHDSLDDECKAEDEEEDKEACGDDEEYEEVKSEEECWSEADEDKDDECKAEDEEEDEESKAMHTEVLQSVEELKDLAVDRDALAFTFWDNDGTDPYWVIQAAGKPVAEVHLADQKDAEDVRAFFCDQTKWPNVIAQSVERTSLYEMLAGVKARFYANQISKSTLAERMKKEAVAELKDTRVEKLGTLRRDFTEALVVAAEALNKGLFSKPNALKKAFVDRLTSLGIYNAGLVVEDCFADGFAPFLDQVIADAGEYLEMPREAFAKTKQIVSASANVAHNTVNSYSRAGESLASRLERNSMPLASNPGTFEAPSVQAELERAYQQEGSASEKERMRRRLRLNQGRF